jgi:hypothetical protein
LFVSVPAQKKVVAVPEASVARRYVGPNQPAP